MSDFVHLHRHSEWSLLDGCGSNKEYAAKAKELGHTALALTDHGTLAGSLYHMLACEEAGIQPIFGMEGYFRPDATLHDKDTNWQYYHILLLAKDHDGWQNLMRLSSIAYDEQHFYRKPCMDWKLLEQYSKGLIATTGCASSIICKALEHGHDVDLPLEQMLKIFGDDLFVEIQPHDFDLQRQLNPHLIDLAYKKGIPLVAGIDVHYPHKDWNDTQDVLLMINTNQSLASRELAKAEGEDFMQFSGDTFYLMSRQEAFDTFKQYHPKLSDFMIEDALRGTVDAASRCKPFKLSDEKKMPKLSSSKLTAEAQLRQWCEEGLAKFGKQDDPVYRERLERELGVMRRMNVLDYFIMIGDLVKWAKENGIRVGPGRGSAGGSLVSFLCGITALDPIGYGLLFERFLNEYRIEMPDIDIDFQHDRRDEVKDYLKRKYGEDHVVDVASFQSFGVKAVIQSVARAMDIPYDEALEVTKTLDENMPKDTQLTLEQILPVNDKLEAFVKRYPDAWKHIVRLEGQIKGISKHPAAVIVTDKPTMELIPSMRGNDGTKITQWSERSDLHAISKFGFLKIDALSTDALTAQQHTIDLIEQRHGIRIDFEDPVQHPEMMDPDLAEFPVVASFADGRNLGVFQFASGGIIGLLRDIGPEKLEHIIATNALFRPGTIYAGVHKEYALRKNGKAWTLPHQVVSPFLSPTYGLIAYQEQVMQVVQSLGGFDAQESAQVFRAMTKLDAKVGDKKRRDAIGAYEDRFIAGAAQHGVSKKEAFAVWEAIINMMRYCFNRAHAAGYALQGYQDKWLKVHYPVEFYTSLATHENRTGKVPYVVREARTAGVRFGPPDVNESDADFTIASDNTIRFGLQAVKNVGWNAIQELKLHRPYASVDDLRERVTKRKCNSRVIDSLLRAGAMDSIGGRDGWTDVEKAEAERELLGLALTKKRTKRQDEIISARIWDKGDLDKADGEKVVVGGEIVEMRDWIVANPRSRNKGKRMGQFTVAYSGEEYGVTMFAWQYEQYGELVKKCAKNGDDVLVYGSWNANREEMTLDEMDTVASVEKQLKKEAAGAGRP